MKHLCYKKIAKIVIVLLLLLILAMVIRLCFKTVADKKEEPVKVVEPIPAQTDTYDPYIITEGGDAELIETSDMNAFGENGQSVDLPGVSFGEDKGSETVPSHENEAEAGDSKDEKQKPVETEDDQGLETPRF